MYFISQNQEENTFYNTRNLLIAEEGSKVELLKVIIILTILYIHQFCKKFFYPNAKADWHKLQNDNDTSYLVDNTFARQEKDSLTTVNTFSFGGKLVRNNLDFIHNGENINSFMNGLRSLKDQLVDHHTAVHHNFPNCESYQNYKGVLMVNHTVFQRESICR
jgi:Fe-S cluster assembly protein SufD